MSRWKIVRNARKINRHYWEKQLNFRTKKEGTEGTVEGGQNSNAMGQYTVSKLQRKLTSLQDFEIQIPTPTVTDTTAASMVARSMRFFHRTGGTAFELFQKTVYLIFDASRWAGHLFARHSSVNVNVLEMETRADLIGTNFYDRRCTNFGQRTGYILWRRTYYSKIGRVIVHKRMYRCNFDRCHTFSRYTMHVCLSSRNARNWNDASFTAVFSRQVSRRVVKFARMDYLAAIVLRLFVTTSSLHSIHVLR